MAKHNKKESGKGVPFAAFAVGLGFVAVGCIANMETGTAQELADREVVQEVKFGNFRESAKVDADRVIKYSTPEEGLNKPLNCREGMAEYIAWPGSEDEYVQKYCVSTEWLEQNVATSRDGK